jgi:7,8-dihydroneopterin aldolase/epimerase/oxygenase
MARIALEGMQFYAYHGFYEEEQVIGTDYVVDVYIDTVSVTKAAIDDDLYQTINYETIYLICDSVMRTKSKLLEAVANRIALGIKNQFKFVKELKVRVKKLNPPLGGRVDAAFVEVDGEYNKRCGRCEKPMLCYGDNTCWCMETQLFQKTAEQLKGHYGDRCLCKDCLEFYAK